MENPQLHISQWSDFLSNSFFGQTCCTTAVPFQHCLPVWHSLNKIFHHISGAFIIQSVLSYTLLLPQNLKGSSVSSLCIYMWHQHGATFPVASLTNGSSFWRAVNCNRHQTPCTENRGASAASSIHSVNESCLNCQSGYKMLHLCPAHTQCRPKSARTVNNKPQRRSGRLSNQHTNTTKVRNNFMRTITAVSTVYLMTTASLFGWFI